jgi:thiol-disulfide isomerase/thioredoxin
LPASPNPPQGLPVGAEAPPFSLPNLAGARVSLSDLIAGPKPAVLLFVHPDCGPCRSLLTEAPEWQRRAEGRFRLAVISQGSRKENLAKITGLHFEHFLLQDNREVSEAYKTIATPGAALVSHDGKIALPAVFGAEAIRSLVASVMNQAATGLAPVSVSERDPVPRLVYPDLDGKMRLLPEVVDGEHSLLLFWNTGCGYCRQMLPDLKTWERQPAGERRRIVLVSTGSVEQNRNMGLKCPILIDSGFTLGRAFGASGTPSAVLVDAEARIASKLAVGRDEILALTLKQVSKTAAT